MKKSLISVCLVIFILFVTSCGGSTTSDASGDIGDEAYYESDDTGYEPGYNDNSDTGDSGYYDNSDTGYPNDPADPYEDWESTDGEMSGDDMPAEEPKPGELIENEWVETATENTSTFSIDVDTASYTLIRNYLMSYNYMPPKDKVRIEEMVNYFDYDYPQPEEGKPFSVTMEMADSPWRSDTKLVMFGLQGKELEPDKVPAHNLVFLIDVSGSMYGDDRLGLLKKSFKKLVEKLDKDDKVSIVTYASGTAVVLDSVSGDKKDEIIAAIDDLEAGGSTAGAAGIQSAYALAEKNYSKDANNRIILATDGDFNVGISNTAQLVSYIEEERNKGIYLTILGFGMGNYQDDRMEQLSNAGNGNYFYVDNERESDKIFTYDLMGTMFTIAKDVKLQVVFNPAKIAKYRLIGYENRVMANEDFNDDTKDAGEIGAGHRVTAFYEVFLTEKPAETPETETEPEEGEEPAETDPNEDDPAAEPDNGFGEDEFLVLKMRYKEPDEDISKYMDTLMTSANIKSEMSQNMGFASAVAEFGMLLRDSKFKADSSYDSVLTRAQANIGEDKFGYRGEFLEIVERAKSLDH
ncbi:von Willebrand factor type A domain-containing protein [bacterium]|nr:von Willebrand factor type A domain-containing protein [bacterium]